MLQKYLSALPKEEILYVPNPGNAGDALIASATFQVFNKLNVTYRVIDINCPLEETRGRVVVYGGGGNLIDLYQNASIFVKRHHQVANKLIILPQTIRGHIDLLGELGGNVDIFCREDASFEFVTKYAPNSHVFQMEDMALSLDVNEILNRGALNYAPIFLSKKLAFKNAKRNIRTSWHGIRNIAHPKSLNAFRQDVEGTNIQIPFSNIDVSHVLSPQAMTEEWADESSFRTLEFLRRFDVVRTNRLHICISSLLLGKRVEFYDNSYGKNRNVYEFSLKNRFDNLVWHS